MQIKQGYVLQSVAARFSHEAPSIPNIWENAKASSLKAEMQTSASEILKHLTSQGTNVKGMNLLILLFSAASKDNIFFLWVQVGKTFCTNIKYSRCKKPEMSEKYT